MSHTPGRWYAEPPDEKGVGQLSMRNFCWKVRYECTTGPAISAEIALVTSMNTSHEEANARLMAAAPDLLEALQKYVAAGFGNSTDPYLQGQAYDAAIEAIAKATQ
jgi:hypothetical protein